MHHPCTYLSYFVLAASISCATLHEVPPSYNQAHLIEEPAAVSYPALFTSPVIATGSANLSGTDVAFG